MEGDSHLEVHGLSTLSASFSFDRPYNKVFPWLRKQLSRAGLRTMRTFSVATAHMDMSDCPCPNHETGQCDCEMMVLLVYGKSAEPATLILHGSHGQSWLSLVNNADRPFDPGMQSAIEQALQLNLLK